MRPFDNHPDELISASVTGDLTDVERRELDAHLSTCQVCRETLEAFSQQRQLLAGLPISQAPRDLGARVRTKIAAGRFGVPWWRRPGGLLPGLASIAAVAAVALFAVLLTNGSRNPQVGTSLPPSASAAATATPSASSTPSPTQQPTPAPLPLGMKPGDLVYTQLTGPSDGLKLTVIDEQRGGKISLDDPKSGQFGAVQRAVLSPDGRLLAFATDSGLKGTWRIFVANLENGTVQQLAETLPVAFGRRVAWSPEGRYLAFTVAPPESGGNRSGVWLYDRTTHVAKAATGQGSAGPPAYFASWAPLRPGDNEQLWFSFGEENPVSQLAQFPVNGGAPADLLGGEMTTVGGVFAPLVSPDGSHVLYWNGTMHDDGQTGFDFGRGGMPQLATLDPTATSWQGTALFTDLVPQQDGAAFASGELTWAQDSSAYAFWAGQWTGTPEGNGYPDANAVYFGRLSSGALSHSSALDLGSMKSGGNDLYLVDVSLAPGGDTASVTLGIPLPGDLSAPQSFLRAVPTRGGSAADVGSGGASPPPWSGPGSFFAPAR
jgi:Putative zinc-finger/WD40-like Beta Propeller Repeat